MCEYCRAHLRPARAEHFLRISGPAARCVAYSALSGSKPLRSCSSWTVTESWTMSCVFPAALAASAWWCDHGDESKSSRRKPPRPFRCGSRGRARRPARRHPSCTATRPSYRRLPTVSCAFAGVIQHCRTTSAGARRISSSTEVMLLLGGKARLGWEKVAEAADPCEGVASCGVRRHVLESHGASVRNPNCTEVEDKKSTWQVTFNLALTDPRSLVCSSAGHIKTELSVQGSAWASQYVIRIGPHHPPSPIRP